METNIAKTERLIREINRFMVSIRKDYFETGKVQKINLSHTLKTVPIEPILSYRLNLHEAINDYLAFADTQNIDFFTVLKRLKVSMTKSIAIWHDKTSTQSIIF